MAQGALDDIVFERVRRPQEGADDERKRKKGRATLHDITKEAISTLDDCRYVYINVDYFSVLPWRLNVMVTVWITFVLGFFLFECIMLAVTHNLLPVLWYLPWCILGFYHFTQHHVLSEIAAVCPAFVLEPPADNEVETLVKMMLDDPKTLRMQRYIKSVRARGFAWDNPFGAYPDAFHTIRLVTESYAELSKNATFNALEKDSDKVALVCKRALLGHLLYSKTLSVQH